MAESGPHLLILETSSRVGQVALAQGDTVLSVRRLDETRRHARDLAPAVAELLVQQNWKPNEMHGVLVSLGPGSYTGLRVGLMSAKTFAYAIGCPLLGVETFSAIALQAPEAAHRLDVIADAQQEKVYLQRFAWDDLAKKWHAEALRIERISDWLAGRPADAWVTGPGMHTYAKQLPPGIPQVDPEHWDPRPESLWRGGLARFAGGP